MSAELVHIFETADYDAQLRRGAELIRDGGVAILPTETVYGAAAMLSNPEGAKRLRAIRGTVGKPFTVHLAKADDAHRYIGEVGELGGRMIRKLWPGPVGLMFDVSEERRHDVAATQGVEEQDLYEGSTITLRCPDHPVASEILTQVPGPVALTRAGSADRAPEPAEVDGQADMIFDAGPSRFSKPSTIVRLLPAANGQGQRYEIVRAGVYDERIIERLLTTTVLFVCSGNTCRSPMAEALARKLLAERLQIRPELLETKGYSVVSAGSFAMPGARATPQAMDAVKGLGADLSRHRSQPLTVELIHQADAIFTMGRGHAQSVLSLVPSANDKTRTLDPTGDIDDPIGGDLSLYKDLAGYLEKLIDRRLSETVLPGVE